MIKNVFIKKLLKESVFRVISVANIFIPKKDNYILLYSGNKGINFNLLPVRDYLIENGYAENNKLICGIEDSKFAENDGCTYVTHMKALFYYLQSKYVFYTAGQLPIKPSSRQMVVHLQHGITFKTCGLLTRINNGNEFYFSKCLATSEIYKSIYSKAFGCKESNIYINSEPVTDIFFGEYQKYDLGDYEKILLWAPTFRQSDYLGYDDSTSEALLPLFEETDYEELNSKLAFHNYKLIVKIHPMQDLSANKKLHFSNLDILSNADFAQLGYELYNLLPQVDALIADYSSLFLQFLLLDKPIGFVIPDIDIYRNRRGFVFENAEQYMPGERIKTKDEFYDFLDELDFDKYATERKSVKETIHKFSDGKSCERLIEYSGIKK